MLEHFDDRRYLIPFRSLLLPHIFTDTLVLGAGVAGMRAAIEAANHGDVILLAKGPLDLSCTAWAQGGLAAARAEDDSPAAHFEDTISAGAGLCDADAVRVLVDETPARVDELLDWGMRFDRDAEGHLDYGREGGHRHRRILHTGGAATGEELVRCLASVVRGHERVRVFTQCLALDLLSAGANAQRSDGRVLGAITYHQRYGLQIIWAKATILATGGAGQVYRETTNPRVATGDGLAMAYRAGAALADLEFVQFHPTTLYVAGSARQLISEAVRGEGAHLVDRVGRRFMDEYHEMAELAPRDVVSRAIVDHLARSGETHVYLDVRHFPAGSFAARFPQLKAILHDFEIDPARDLVPVHPSAHYTIGGVWTDLEGRSSLPGLYACGEAACLGLHGANRLASNSLSDGLVFGRRAGAAAAEMAAFNTRPRQIVSEILLDEHGELDLVDVRSSLRSAMWRNVGIERSGSKLADVVDMFTFWARYALDKIFDEPAGWETQNLLTVGVLITRSATWRRETRGVHCRDDHPQPDETLHCHTLWRIGADEPERQSVTGARGGDDVSRAVRRAGALVMPAIAATLLGCQPYRVEYHKRPGYYAKAAAAPLPDRVMLDDGTRLVYETHDPRGAYEQAAADDDGRPVEIREENAQGEITLRALLPEHVLANTVMCLRNEEYELLWDQLVAERTKQAYAASGMTSEDFVAFCRRNRRDLLESLMRIMVGLVHQDVVVENIGPGQIRYRLRARAAETLRFSKVDIAGEGFAMKLMLIH